MKKYIVGFALLFVVAQIGYGQTASLKDKMKNLIEDVIRRADNCSKEHVLIELDMICATLQKNVNLTESEMEIEAQCEV